MELRSVIENYEPFNEQEQKDKETILKWMDSFDDVLTRNNEFAHFVSSGIVVNKDRTKVLMVHHNIFNSWAWPGGHADGNSDLLEVAISEVQEETGIKKIKRVLNDPLVIDTISIFGHAKKGKHVSAHVHLSVTYLLEADDKEMLVIQEEENSGVKWVPIEKFATMTNESHMIPIYRKIVEKIQKYNL